MEERQIVQLAKRLGAKAADTLDVERTAQVVISRVKQAPAKVVWWRRMPLLQSAAAAAVFVLTVGVFVVSQLKTNGSDLGVLEEFAELHALSDSELEQVYDSLTAEAPVHELSAVNLQDLNEGQLEELLALMEG